MSNICAIAGCETTGKHRLGLRCRVMVEPSPVAGKSKTDALWSVDTSAYLCDKHALSGLDATVMFEANDTGSAAVRVVTGRGALATRSVKIKTNEG